MQTGVQSTILKTVKGITNDGVLGLYKAYGITILREIPFALVQFPIYEYLKVVVSRQFERTITSYEAALCGSISGGIAAAITTPLDVIKTRLMIGSVRFIVLFSFLKYYN
jgi:solute carrier family 25 S-adenosylmethionine transporter 26